MAIAFSVYLLTFLTLYTPGICIRKKSTELGIKLERISLLVVFTDDDDAALLNVQEKGDDQAAGLRTGCCPVPILTSYSLVFLQPMNDFISIPSAQK